jgi:hypothetical protein
MEKTLFDFSSYVIKITIFLTSCRNETKKVYAGYEQISPGFLQGWRAYQALPIQICRISFFE